ncbi:CNH domain-containing protein [Limtongia smithiae]|uniref:CNH domain-containing protein n=1 Tax=Limtongia smithiae TaxID=1125753 RepID=UPI0034CF1165
MPYSQRQYMSSSARPAAGSLGSSDGALSHSGSRGLIHAIENMESYGGLAPRRGGMRQKKMEVAFVPTLPPYEGRHLDVQQQQKQASNSLQDASSRYSYSRTNDYDGDDVEYPRDTEHAPNTARPTYTSPSYSTASTPRASIDAYRDVGDEGLVEDGEYYIEDDEESPPAMTIQPLRVSRTWVSENLRQTMVLKSTTGIHNDEMGSSVLASDRLQRLPSRRLPMPPSQTSRSPSPYREIHSSGSSIVEENLSHYEDEDDYNWSSPTAQQPSLMPRASSQFQESDAYYENGGPATVTLKSVQSMIRRELPRYNSSPRKAEHSAPAPPPHGSADSYPQYANPSSFGSMADRTRSIRFSSMQSLADEGSSECLTPTAPSYNQRRFSYEMDDDESSSVYTDTISNSVVSNAESVALPENGSLSGAYHSPDRQNSPSRRETAQTDYFGDLDGDQRWRYSFSASDDFSFSSETPSATMSDHSSYSGSRSSSISVADAPNPPPHGMLGHLRFPSLTREGSGRSNASSQNSSLQKWSSVKGDITTDGRLTVEPGPVRANTTGRVKLVIEGNTTPELSNDMKEADTQPQPQPPPQPQPQIKKKVPLISTVSAPVVTQNQAPASSSSVTTSRSRFRFNQPAFYVPGSDEEEDEHTWNFTIAKSDSSSLKSMDITKPVLSDSSSVKPQEISKPTLSPRTSSSSLLDPASMRQFSAGSTSSTSYDSSALNRYGLPPRIPESSARSITDKSDSASIVENMAAGRDCKAIGECEQPWLLSELYKWLRKIMAREANFMGEKLVVDDMIQMFLTAVPTLGRADADRMAVTAITEFIRAGILERDELSNLLIRENDDEVPTIQGVFPLLSGIGCYSKLCHQPDNPNSSGLKHAQCYAPKCAFVKKPTEHFVGSDTDLPEPTPWDERVPIEVQQSLSKSETERQNSMYELITSEHLFLTDLMAFVKFRDDIIKRAGSDRMFFPRQKQAKEMVQNMEELIELNREMYFKLIARRNENFVIHGIGDIMIEWAGLAAGPYKQYAANVHRALNSVNEAKKTSPEFDRLCSNLESVNRGVGPRTVFARLSRYQLQLERMEKNGPPKSELENLTRAIILIRQLCDSFDKTGESGRREYLRQNLKETVVFPSDSDYQVNLMLDTSKRNLVLQSVMEVHQEGGPKHMHPMLVILLDNYLLITRQGQRSGRVCNEVMFPPIPTEFLAILSQSDPPVKRANKAAPGDLSKSRVKMAITNEPMGRELKDRSSTLAVDADSDNKLYPFRIEHLGRKCKTYVIYAQSPSERMEWCSKIGTVNDSVALAANNTAPLKLEVVSDTAFSNAETRLPVDATGYAVERALRAAESDAKLPARSQGPLLTKASVNSITTFYLDEMFIQDSSGGKRKPWVLAGCDNGVFISNGQPRSWCMLLHLKKVTQIQVLPEFGLAILLSEGRLVAYNIQHALALRPFEMLRYDGSASAEKRLPLWLNRMAEVDALMIRPMKITSSHQVAKFSVGVMAGRTVIITLPDYDGGAREICIYEPIAGRQFTFNPVELDQLRDNNMARHNRLENLRREICGQYFLSRMEIVRRTDSWETKHRCIDVTVMKTRVMLHTSRGFYAQTPMISQPLRIPILEGEANMSEVQKLMSPPNGSPNDQPQALGFFSISESEFLVCYSTFCLMCNRHGELSRSLIIKFIGWAQAVAVIGQFVIGFDNNFVEVWNISRGERAQVIRGRGIRLLSKPEFVLAQRRRDGGFPLATTSTFGTSSTFGSAATMNFPRSMTMSSMRSNMTSSSVTSPSSPGFSSSGSIMGDHDAGFLTGGDTGSDVIFCMAHPELAGRQLILRVCLKN